MFYSGVLLARAKEGNMMLVLTLHVISLITLTGRESGSNFPLRRWEYHFVKHYCQKLHCCILEELSTCWLFQVVGWPWPAANHPRTHSLTPSHSVPLGWEEKTRRMRMRKLVCQDKESLIDAGKRKDTEVKERKLLTTSDRQTYTQLISKQWPPWKPKTPFYLSFYRWAHCYIVWSKPLASLGKLSWLCLHPVSCLSPAYYYGTMGKRERLGAVWVCFNNSWNTGVLATLF